MATQTEILRIEVDNKQAQKNIEDQTKKIEELKEENKKLLSINKKLAKEDRDTSKERARNSETIAKNAAVIQKNTQQRKQNISVLQNEKNTLNNLRSQLALLTAERNKNLTVGTKAFKNANKQIAGYNKQIRAAEEGGLDFRRSVGDYARAFEGATASILPFNAALLASPIGAVVAALGALVALGGQVFSFFKEFDTVMSKVKAATSATNEEFQKLKQSTIEFGETSKFTATQVANLQLELAKLGFTTDEIIDATGAILDLATATDSELSRAAEVVAQTLNQFQLEATESQRVADVMAKSFVSSALDIEKFAEGMKNAGTASDLVGVSIEQTTAILSVLADNGVDASTAGTQLKNVFIELADKGLSWEDAMTQINSSQDKLTAANDLFGKRATVVASVIARNGENIDKLSKSFNDAEGSASAMAEIVGNNLQGDLDRLSSSWEGLIARGTYLNKTFRLIINGIKLLIEGFKNIPNVFERMSISIETTFNDINLSILKTFKSMSNLIGVEIDGVENKIDQINKSNQKLNKKAIEIDLEQIERAKKQKKEIERIFKEEEDAQTAEKIKGSNERIKISDLETKTEINNTKKELEEKKKAKQRQKDATFDLELFRKERDAQNIIDAEEKAKALIAIEEFELKKKLENEGLIETERELLIEQSEQRIIEIKADAEAEKQRLADETAAKNDKLRDEELKKNKKAEKEIEETRKQRLQNGLDLTQAAVGLASEIIGRETKAGKALAIAAAGINTAEAITKTLAQYGGTPIGYAQAGVVGATGLAQIAKIKNTDVNSGSGGSGGVGTVSTPSIANNTPQVDTSNVDQEVNQQEVLLAALKSQRYQVSVTEINEVQNAVAVSEENSTI